MCIAVIARALRAEARVLEEQDSFLALVSHQFKTPLASLQLSLETMALRAARRPSSARTLIERMLADLARMEVMVTQILESARLERGRVGSQVASRSSCARRWRAWSPRSRSARARQRISDQQRHRPGSARARRSAGARCRRAQSCSRTRSPRWLPVGGGSIALSARALDGEIELAVRDSGVGFRPADGARLFEKFTRLHPGGGSSHYGTGLGLFIVQRLMQLAQGRVSAHSDGVGQGRALRAHLARGTGPAPMSTPQDEHGRAARVLVVEDDPHLAAGVMENLRAEGYEVERGRRRRRRARVAARARPARSSCWT